MSWPVIADPFSNPLRLAIHSGASADVVRVLIEHDAEIDDALRDAVLAEPETQARSGDVSGVEVVEGGKGVDDCDEDSDDFTGSSLHGRGYYSSRPAIPPLSSEVRELLKIELARRDLGRT